MNPRPGPTVERLGGYVEGNQGDGGEKVPLKMGGQYLSEQAARHYPMGGRDGGESGPGPDMHG